MAIDYLSLKTWPFVEVEQSHTDKDSMLYALGLGLGIDPLDRQKLRLVFEKDLLALPTLALVLGHPGFWAGHPDSGIEHRRPRDRENLLRLSAGKANGA